MRVRREKAQKEKEKWKEHRPEALRVMLRGDCGSSGECRRVRVQRKRSRERAVNFKKTKTKNQPEDGPPKARSSRSLSLSLSKIPLSLLFSLLSLCDAATLNTMTLNKYMRPSASSYVYSNGGGSLEPIAHYHLTPPETSRWRSSAACSRRRRLHGRARSPESSAVAPAVSS